MINEQVAAAETGDHIIWNMLPGVSVLPMARNQIAKTFMLSDCDRLVFLDSDVTWQVGELLKIARHKEDFVGGAYRYKWEEKESYPVSFDMSRGELWANENGLLEVINVPTGFLSLSKNVFHLLDEKYPERSYEHMGNAKKCYFSMPFEDSNLYGEDAHFCKLYREAGGFIWLDPELNLTHWKNHQAFHGHIGNWLRNRGENK